MNAPIDALGLVGTVVDQKYRVEAVVGEGGFSIVYRAEHIIWKQPVALKCFNALAGVPPQMRQELLQAFIQEGKLMTSLSSRTAAIVQARDVGSLTAPRTNDQVPFMVLEWLDGRPLDKILHDERDRGAPARTIFDVLAQLESVASALEVVHAQNIAHRDIKPANLFVIGDPRGAGSFVKILDFGIAKVMAEHAQLATSLAQTGREITAFTPNYGAPEQFSRAHGATGPWTDVFALALIMVEMLRGGWPALQGDDYIQLAVASRDPQVRPTPRTFGVEVNDDVELVFRRALAVAPRDRYKTAGQFWGDLHAAVFPGSAAWSPMTVGGGVGAAMLTSDGSRPSMANLSTGARGNTTGPRMQTGQNPPGAAPTTPLFVQGGTGPGVAAAPVEQPKKGNGTVFAILGAVALLGGGLGAYFAFGRTPAKTPGASAEPSSSAPQAGSESSATTTESNATTAVPATCPAGMVKIDGGKFFMGSDDPGFPLWSPAHRVQLSPYCLDIYEVTTEAYKACVNKGECKRAETVPDYPKSEKTSADQHEKNRKAFSEFCNFGDNAQIKPGREKHPVNCLSWELADNYCKVQGGRLPTEAEWEFAARDPDQRKFPWGDEPGDDGKHMNAGGLEYVAWKKANGVVEDGTPMYDVDDGFPGTAPVGSFPKGVTKWGNYDMVGNVWEWTADYSTSYTKDDQTDPVGPKVGERKAIRGGGFNGAYVLWVNPAFRFHMLKTASSHGIGFRCAKSLK
ncbi:MAG: bifunctional serine/threonine-protein kinase/formylglycine-generating enzyme family protein [Polyangiaceae bacterium]